MYLWQQQLYIKMNEIRMELVQSPYLIIVASKCVVADHKQNRQRKI